MTVRIPLACLLIAALALPLLAGELVFLPDASRDGAITGSDQLVWTLPEGLLVLDRTNASWPADAAVLAAGDDDAEWYLVHRPHLGRGRPTGGSFDPAAYGYVHLTSEIAWVLEVPRDRVDALHASGMAMQYIDRSRGPSPASGLAEADVERMLPDVDETVKTAFVDALDQATYDQLLRELSGDAAIWQDGLPQTIATRYYNTAGNDVAAAYLAEQLAGWGYTVELDVFTVNGHPCQNVVATKLGTTYPDEFVVLGGHYDSTSPQSATLAPGCEDNGSGTTLVMEVARVSAERQFERSVQFALFDAEEVGLRGSQHFVAEAGDEGRDIVAAITVDMVSYYDDDYAVIIEGQTEWQWLMTAMADNVTGLTDIDHRQDYFSWGSDHVPFQQAGIPAFLAIDWDYASYPHYHQTSDTWQAVAPTVGIALQIARAAAGTLADVAGLQAEVTASPDTAPSPALRLSAHPNPFNPRTVLAFELDQPATGELVIHDLAGRRVATLASGTFAVGPHRVTWLGADDGGRSVPSGVYVARLATSRGATSIPLNLVR
jgi:hypothetical protein